MLAMFVLFAEARREWSATDWLILSASPVTAPIYLFIVIALAFADGGSDFPTASFQLSVGYMVPAVAAYLIVGRRRRLQTRRVLSGLCGWCGYDMRHSPGRCPECGGERFDYLRYDS